MATYRPLIVNAAANQIQELASGDSLVGNLIGTATTATNISIATTTSSDTTTSIVLVANQSTGNQSPFIDSGLTYNANTNILNSDLYGSAITSGTEQSINADGNTYTGIPSWVKKITIMFDGLSISSSGESANFFFVDLLTGDDLVAQYESTSSAVADDSVGTTSSSSSFLVRIGSPSLLVHGHMTITLMGENYANSPNNKWISSHTFSRYSTSSIFGGGRVSIQSNAAVNSVRIRPETSRTFDAGSFNVMFE